MTDDREQLIVLLDKATRYASILDKASVGVQFRRAFIARKADLLISPAEGYDKKLFQSAPEMASLLGEITDVVCRVLNGIEEREIDKANDTT